MKYRQNILQQHGHLYVYSSQFYSENHKSMNAWDYFWNIYCSTTNQIWGHKNGYLVEFWSLPYIFCYVIIFSINVIFFLAGIFTDSDVKDMFFLPAELTKEARSEILSHWMETWVRVGISLHACHMVQFFVSCLKVQQLFPTPPPPRPLVKSVRESNKRTTSSSRLSLTYLCQGSFLWYPFC